MDPLDVLLLSCGSLAAGVAFLTARYPHLRRAQRSGANPLPTWVAALIGLSVWGAFAGAAAARH